MKPAILAILAAMLGGCASIVEGTTQDLFVSVTPESAVCNAAQKGKEVARYDHATMTMHVPKSRNDLFITCVAPGYKNKFVKLTSEASGWGITGALLLDFGIVDYSTGALNKYDGTVVIVMERDDQAG